VFLPAFVGGLARARRTRDLVVKLSGGGLHFTVLVEAAPVDCGSLCPNEQQHFGHRGLRRRGTGGGKKEGKPGVPGEQRRLKARRRT